ncbi:MAG TPA: DUF4136 domain-containing protein [Cyclobacteriaceae bacterium]|nr:DUF4136 domain-containing protein [Cyclobacteriaceae bacterium]
MKTLSIIFLALLCGIAVHAQQKQAVGNSKINTDFSKYKTFTWAQSDPTVVGPNGYDIYYYEFEADDHRDHKMKDNAKMDKAKADRKTARKLSQDQPAYIYSYSVIIPAKDPTANGVIQDAISNELEGRGYREASDAGDLIVAYQVLEQRASLHGFSNDDPAIASGQEIRQPSDTTTFALEPGTLIVNLIDKETSEVVWTGFSSNMADNNAFVTDEGELKEAIHNIFEEFKYTADKARKD